MSLNSPDKIFDELLLLRYQDGDKKALELLIKRWNPKIMNYAIRNTGDYQGAEDVAQEVWISMLKGYQQIRNFRKIGTWLLGVTHNKSVDWIKKNPKPINQQPGENIESPNENKEEQINRMRQALTQLNMDQQNVLSLFYLEGFTLHEIADILDISIGTVKSRLFYARESLKKQIQKEDYER